MEKRPWTRVTEEQRLRMIQLAKSGLTFVEIARQVGVSDVLVGIYLRPYGGVIRGQPWVTSPARLSLDDRVEIKLGLERRESMRSIARRIGRHVSTVSREVSCNAGVKGYKPMDAHVSARDRARRPKARKLGVNPKLRDRVAHDLRRFYSPEQISARLKEEFGDDPCMNISHETIYKTLFVQGRGELKRELARCLRTGRAQRIPANRMERRGRLKDMVPISERPAEVQDRAVPGHWEGDLLIGQKGKSALGTLVERSTRYVMLFALPDGYSAEKVREAMTKTIKKLPASLCRTLTWDQGREMAQHVQFTIDTGVQVYFCDPHSPWQRGSNENTNGLLRQYFPKGMDLSMITPAQLRWAQDTMNDRPRKTLGWRKPKEVLSELVASTG